MITEQQKNTLVQSKGTSSDVIIDSVIDAAKKWNVSQGAGVIDLGAGQGTLLERLRIEGYTRLTGADLMQFQNFDFCKFVSVDLNTQFSGNLERTGCVTTSEVIEHVENPRNYIREISRILNPRGIVILTTPNPESLSSLISLLLRGYFSSFGPKDYPAHITPVLHSQLKNILNECGLELMDTVWIQNGRIPGTSLKWPRFWPFRSRRIFSENYLIVAQKLMSEL